MGESTIASRLLDVMEGETLPMTARGVAAGNKVFGAALLRKTEYSIDDQKRAYHGEIGIFPEHRRQDHNQFQHPRRQPPEFCQKCEHRMRLLNGDLVGAILLPAGCRFDNREPCLGIYL